MDHSTGYCGTMDRMEFQQENDFENITDLPQELLMNIFLCLDSYQHLILSRVCRTWEDLLNTATMKCEIFLDFSNVIVDNSHEQFVDATQSILKCLKFSEFFTPESKSLIIRGPLCINSSLSQPEVAIQEMLFRNVYLALRSSQAFWNGNRKGHFHIYVADMVVPQFHLHMLLHFLVMGKTDRIYYRLQNIIITSIFGENYDGNWKDMSVKIPTASGILSRREDVVQQLSNLIERHITPISFRELEMLKIVFRGELLCMQQNARRTIIQTIKMFEPSLQKVTAQQLSTLNLGALRKTTLCAVWMEISKLNLIFHACG